MAHVAQTVGPFVGGVSQTPAHLRSPLYSEDLLNAIGHPSLGITKRPGTRHVARLGGTGDFTGASIFPFTAGDERRYFLVVRSGGLLVIDAETGASMPVTMAPGALSYLTTVPGTEDPFDATVLGNTLYLANRTKVVGKASTVAGANRPAEALVTIVAADYGTRYALAINGAQNSVTTPDGSDPMNRGLISTDHIATTFADLFATHAATQGITIDRHGSTLYLRRNSGPLLVTASDGLADQGIRVVMGSVQSGDLLPPSGVVAGVTLEVSGDPRTGADNYWVEWRDGMWQECARPGSLNGLDPATMPHKLVLGGTLREGIKAQLIPTTAAIDNSPITGKLNWFTGGNSRGRVGGFTIPERGFATAVKMPNVAGPTTLNVEYDVVAPILSNEEMQVILRVNGVMKASKVYTRSLTPKYNETLTWTGSMSLEDTIQLEVNTGITPLAPVPEETRGGEVYVNVHTPSPFTVVDATRIRIPTDVDYPPGVSVTMTVDGQTKSFTTTAASTSGSEIAAYMTLGWGGGLIVAYEGSGTLSFKKNGGGGLSASVNIAASPNVLRVAGGGLVPGSLVGHILQNLSTGNASTISSNTSDTITVSSMPGGFNAGDTCRVVASPDTFLFTAAAWEQRRAGDDVSNPFPSFVDNTIGTLSNIQNRLMLTSGEFIVLSAAGKPECMFRTTTQTLLDSDVVDIRGGVSTSGQPYRHTVSWSGGAHLLTDRGLLRLDGAPVITPRTVGITHLFDLASSAVCRPVVAGRRLYIARSQNGATQLLAVTALPEGAGVDSEDVTRECPTFCVGRPLTMASDAGGMLFLVTDRGLYAMLEVFAGQSSVFAWARWHFDAGAVVLAASMEGGDLAMVIRRSDGVYLETLDSLPHA